uniref:Exocyst subunit Exo70 family protein n=1 Tax=Triticum urartu TaxID=4572 RepID=A0A8R7PLP5_TRIUA
MRSTILGHSGSSYSTASNSCPSSNSGYSSGSASAVAQECLCLGNQELKRIARGMVSDGYTRRMVQAFDGASYAPPSKHGGSPDHALDNWFSELDVDWVLQIHDEQGLRRLLQDKPATTTRDLADKWIRALTVIAASITELLFAFHTTPAVVLFGKASITELFDVVDVIITVLEEEKLQIVLDMFTCVYIASHMFTPFVVSPQAQSIFNEIGGLLERQGNLLSEIIASTMEEVRTVLVKEHDSWVIEIPRGGGEVHKSQQHSVHHGLRSIHDECTNINAKLCTEPQH